MRLYWCFPSFNSDMIHFISLFATHHQDLLWKWTSNVYSTIRERQFSRWADLFSKFSDFVAVVEQAESLREYLLSHPGKKNLFQRMLADNRLVLTGGAVIPDSNLVSGETLVRILQDGRSFFRSTFGIYPLIDNRTDAFGMCGQLPQILTQLRYKYLRPGRTPNLPEAIRNKRAYRWIGLNGSCIVVVRPRTVPPEDRTSARPLCQTLEEGLRESFENARRLALDEDVLIRFTTATGIIPDCLFACLKTANRQVGETNRSSGNESLPKVVWRSPLSFLDRIDRRKLPKFRGEMNPVFTGCYSLRVRDKQFFRRLENALFSVEALDFLSQEPKAELKSGGFIAKAISSSWRELQYLAFHDSICGCIHDIVSEELRKRQLRISSLISSALKDITARVSKLCVFNPSSFGGMQVVEWPATIRFPSGVLSQKDELGSFALLETNPLGLKAVSAATKNVPKTFGKRDIFASRMSIRGHESANFRRLKHPDSNRFQIGTKLEIICAPTGPVILYGKQALPVSRPGSTFGEIIFRHDSGSLWTESFWGGWLGQKQSHVSVTKLEDGPLYLLMQTKGRAVFSPDMHDITGRSGIELTEPYRALAGDGSSQPFWDGFGELHWRSTWRFFKMDGHFTLNLGLDWKGNNTKIAIQFPLSFPPEKTAALYSVPFGSQLRSPYYEVEHKNKTTFVPLQSDSDLNDAKGDWPTGPWIDCRGPEIGMAVGNMGTSGQQYVNGNLIVSLLRSPTAVHHGGMRPQPGAWDWGHHEYEFSFVIHDSTDYVASCRAGDILNRKPQVIIPSGNHAFCPGKSRPNHFLSVFPQSLVVSTLRMVSDGFAVLRVFETAGQKTEAEIRSSFKYQLEEGDLTEESWHPASQKLEFAPFEIKTFRLKLESS